MNYLYEINAFHRWLEIGQLNATDQALWFHLMDICNRCGWAEWFTVANMSIQARLGGIDKKTLERHRLHLINAELIEYKSQGKRQAGKYHLISLSAKDKVVIGGNFPLNLTPEEGIRGNIPLETTLFVPKNDPNLSPLNKLNKTKQNNNINILKKDFAEFVKLSDDEFQKLVEKFGEVDVQSKIDNLSLYKQSTGKKYASDYATILAWARKDAQKKQERSVKDAEKHYTGW